MSLPSGPPAWVATPALGLGDIADEADDAQALRDYERRLKRSFVEVYKGWRNQARRYDVHSLLDRALAALQHPAADRLSALKGSPWGLCLLVKWILQDRMMDCTSGKPPVTDAQFDQLRQRLWDFTEEIELSITSENPLHLWLRRLLRPQLGFQVAPDAGMLRETGMILALPPNHGLRGLCERRLGLSLEHLAELSLLILGYVRKGPLLIPPAVVQHWARVLGPEPVAAFFTLVAPSLQELRRHLRVLPDATDKVTSELFEFPVLTRWPFVRTAEGAQCWHPFVFYRGIETLLHRTLAQEGQAYIDRFSKIFEAHVVAQAARSRLPCFDEQTLRTWLPEGQEVVDAIVSDAEVAVLIESKAGLFDESVMTAGDRTRFAHQTRALTKAVRQLWSVAGALPAAEKAPGHLRTAGVFGLIVTNQDLSIGSAERLAKMYPPAALAPQEPAHAAGAERLPLSRIYIVGVANYERFMEAVGAGELALGAFLNDIQRADAQPSTMRFSLDQHLGAAGVPVLVSPVAETTTDAARQRIVNALDRAGTHG